MFKLFFTAIMLFTATFAYADQESEMLYPSAKVTTKSGTGSATAIKVDLIMGTYLVTTYHVVKTSMDNIKVQFYGQDEEYTAYVHSIDVQNDIAVIITRYKHTAIAVIGNSPKVFDEAFCVGASLGQPIAPSKGIITGIDARLFGSRYVTRTDCKIIGGNSGGGLFVKQGDVYKLVGMPVMLVSVNTGFGSTAPITFMGAAVRIEDVRWHLYRHGVLNIPPLMRNGVN